MTSQSGGSSAAADGAGAAAGAVGVERDGERSIRASKCVHELFEEQVGRTPEAVAVVYEDEQLTYGELNRRANQLAHYLRELGVRPETRVAICVERGLEMVVGLLGVLKAEERMCRWIRRIRWSGCSYMVEDSAPVVLLTQGHLRSVCRS